MGLARDIYTALDSALAILAGERFALKIPRTAGALVLVCTEKLNPRVLMVKSAQDGVRPYETGSLNRPRIRRIFV